MPAKNSYDLNDMVQVNGGEDGPVRDENDYEDEQNVNEHYANDENKERGNWSGKAEFLLSMIGYCVGLGNVWRFPYFAYKHGGGAFLIPYWTCALVIGLPLFYMEIIIGQYSSSGPITAWRMAPVMYGLGFSSLLISFFVSIYYNMIAAWGIFFMFASFTTDLPWKHCGRTQADNTWTDWKCVPYDFSTLKCEGYATSISPFHDGMVLKGDDGVCYGVTETQMGDNCTSAMFDDMKNSVLPENFTWGGKLHFTASGENATWPLCKLQELGFHDLKMAAAAEIKPILSAEQYLHNYVYQEEADTDLTNLGEIRWPLILCLLLAWIIVFLCLINGIKTSGKVVYFTCIFPYVALFVLLIRGLTLPGSEMGIKAYLTPDLTKIGDVGVWVDAANQLFYSLAPGWGTIIALSSYNKFHNNAFRDAAICTLADSLTSLLAGLVVYSFLGFYANELNQGIDEVVRQGPGLVFIIYPSALVYLAGDWVWSIIFFFMIVVISMDSEFNMVEAIITGLLDIFPQFRTTMKKKVPFFACLCVFMFCLGIPLTTQGGEWVVDTFNTYSAGWPLFVVCAFEGIGVVWVYGGIRFQDDATVMMPWYQGPVRHIHTVFIGFITPAFTLFLAGWSLKDYAGGSHGDWAYPTAQELGAQMMPALEFLCLPMGLIYMVGKVGWLKLFTPFPDCGPYLVKHRRLVDHVDGFVVNPRKELPEYAEYEARAKVP